MVENFRFSSQGFAQDKAFERYQTLYSGGAFARRTDAPFSAEVRCWRLDRILLFDRVLSGVIHERPALRIKDDAFSHFTVTLVREGVLYGGPGSGFDQVQPNQIVLLDMRRPASNRMEFASLLTASVARDLIEAAHGSASGVHGRIIDATDGGLLADYMRSLAARASALGPNAKAPVSRAFVELLALALAPTGSGSGVALAREAFARREAIQRFVETHLETPELGTAMIVAGTGVSRTTLYRLMDPHGGIARFIATRRIARVRAMLDEMQQNMTLSDLADRYCLSSASRLSKKFREHFGTSPSEYRRILNDPDLAIEALKQRWAAWMVEIR